MLVAAGGNGWSLQVFGQVMDRPAWRAEACGWNDSLQHKEQYELGKNEAAGNSKIQLKSFGVGTLRSQEDKGKVWGA